jgi:DNA-binding transcriptional regulator YiaG
MTKKFKGEAASIAYEMAESLYKNGIINDEAMREFDDVCLLFEQAALQRIREPEQTSSYLPAYK